MTLIVTFKERKGARSFEGDHDGSILWCILPFFKIIAGVVAIYPVLAHLRAFARREGAPGEGNSDDASNGGISALWKQAFTNLSIVLVKSRAIIYMSKHFKSYYGLKCFDI